MDNFLDIDLYEEDVEDSSTNKSYNDIKISIPGGYKETPSSEYDDGYSKIIIPNGSDIKPESYNSILKDLQKTFETATSVIDIIINNPPKNNEILYEDYEELNLEELQEIYTEGMIEAIIFESYCEGPYFEAVSHPDKKEIKKIISELRKLQKSGLKYQMYMFEDDIGSGVKFFGKNFALTIILSFLIAGIYGIMGRPFTGIIAARSFLKFGTIVDAAMTGLMYIIHKFGKMYIRSIRENKELMMQMWQMIGTFLIKKGQTLEEAMKYFNKQFEDIIGDFKLNAVKLETKDGKKHGSTVFSRQGDRWDTYLLILDSKINPVATISINVDAEKAMEDMKEQAEKIINKKSNSSTDVKKEFVEIDDNIDLYDLDL